jgi:Zn-dependent protease with chaperone function
VHGTDQKFTKAGFVGAYVVPALLLFAIPILGCAFAAYAEADHPQLAWLRRASAGSLLLGVASVAVTLGCAGLAFLSRELQYASFVAGWSFLRAASAIQVAAQGFIAAALSFWLAVPFTGRASAKVVGVVGFLAVAAVAAVVKAIFVRLDDTMRVEGEPIARPQAPALWARIDGLCARLGTAPIDHLIAGIDDNFFVTEHPVHVNGTVLNGRTLFVSLSLLKRLDKGEADAILAHEMAHFSGGDTTFSTRLAPTLSRFQAYLEALHGSLAARPVFHFMLLYWSLIQLALGRTSRERELRADRIAARQTSPASMATALYKVAAYSAYRARVEHELFGRDHGHARLDIAGRVAAGFADYARGPYLRADLTAERFPHPFDSHPPMAVRLNAVGVQPRRSGIAEALAAAGGETWFAEIGHAERIEEAQWAAYEGRFLEAHATSLAYRYLPATAEERGHVERYFPPVRFDDREGAVACTMDCLQIHYKDWVVPVLWADVVKVSSSENTFTGKVLAFRVEIAGRGTETVKLPLRKLAGEDDEIYGRIGAYYDRYLNAKAYQSQAA